MSDTQTYQDNPASRAGRYDDWRLFDGVRTLLPGQVLDREAEHAVRSAERRVGKEGRSGWWR